MTESRKGQYNPEGLDMARISGFLFSITAVVFDKDGEVFHAHRPHPRKEAPPYVIKEVRAYLERIGAKP